MPGPESGRPGLWLRLAAAFYDTLLVAAALFVATAALLPFTDGEAVPAGTLVYDVYLVAVAFGYFGWCWTRGGQTLGLKTWRLRVRRVDGGRLEWRDAALRFAAATLSLAALGAGFLWILIDSERRSWHDLLSGTVVERVPRSEPSPENSPSRCADDASH